MKNQKWFVWAIVILLCSVFIACVDDNVVIMISTKSQTPTADIIHVVKSSESPRVVEFQLTSSHPGTSPQGLWKVYDDEFEGVNLEVTIRLDYDENTFELRITDRRSPAANPDGLATGVYWVSVTEPGYSESDRLGLFVHEPGSLATPVPEVDDDTFVKTMVEQKSVTFLLISTHTGIWRLYDAPNGGAPVDITGSFDAASGILTFTAEDDDIPGGTYYVTVQADEPGRWESGPRIALTILQPVSGTPSATTANASVRKTVFPQASAAFSLTSTNNGIWRVYNDSGLLLPFITASFANGILTLTDDLNIPTGSYFVSVEEAGKRESDTLELTILDAIMSTVPTASVTSLNKTDSPQKAITFALTSSHAAGSWHVYSAAGGSALAPVTAAFSGGNLTLTADGADIASSTYYVTFIEPGLMESTPRLALTVVSQLVSIPPQVISRVVHKTSLAQTTAEYTLTTTHDLNAEFFVYGHHSNVTVLSDVTISRAGNVLTLTSSSGALAGDTYYVSVKEPQRAESSGINNTAAGIHNGRLELNVGEYVIPGSQSPTPVFNSHEVVKTDFTQKSVAFTLTRPYVANDMFSVYFARTGGAALSIVTASLGADLVTLTLTASGANIDPGDYYVSVREISQSLSESPRARLTVTPAPPGGTINILFGGLPSDTVTVTGNTTISKQIGSFTVVVDNPGIFTSFAWSLGTTFFNETGSACVIDVSGLPLGLHRLMVVAYNGSVPFSTELAFTVTN
ncbi:MAG: hypothetical protein FWG89_07815 [Treponema sp.]|nr:hypothetical protein [Treponema sp.]